MRRISGAAIAIAIGSVAVVAPIWISVQLAWNEALGNAETRVQNHASLLVHRGEEASDQLNGALSLLHAVHFPPCSAEETALMEQLAVTSNYIKAIGRIEGNRLECSSLGGDAQIDLGRAELFTEDGAEERFNVWIYRAQVRPLMVISEGGFAFIVDSSLMEDLPDSGPGLTVGVFVPSQPQHDPISSTSNRLPNSWMKAIPKGSSTSFLDDGYVVSVVRAQNADFAAVAAYPSSTIGAHLRPFALIFVPLGLVCAGGLAWAVAHISRNRMSLPSALRRAARRKEFYVEYQPIVELATQRWVGAEALVRWRHNGSEVRPDEFIPTAEQSGVITRITACVAEIVARDLPTLLRFDTDFYVAINLSGPDLLTIETVTMLKDVIVTSHALPSNLHVEATERCFLQAEQSRWMIALIRSQGISVSIDDFGTGYSSLSCLQTLDLDSLKIDKTFVETIGTDGATSHVVPHIIEMAHSLELTMIAEGIETGAQVDFLRSRGVRYGQGWLYGKSMNIAALATALSRARAVKSAGVRERQGLGA